MNRIVALLAACIAMLSTARAATQSDDESFEFATRHTSSWVLTAATNVNWPEGPDAGHPTVASIGCRGESRQFDFSMTGAGDIDRLRARFLGNFDRDGEREEITLLGDHLWLYIDGARWEYANIPAHSTAFSNLQYPPPASDLILPLWRGYQAVRKSADEPWVNLKLIYDRLVSARRMEWSFKSRDWSVVDKRNPKNALPENWRTQRYKIDTDGLHGAVLWCARQVASEAAYILPAAMRDRLHGGGRR